MRIVFAGTPEPAVPSLRALLASAHEVVAVVTRPPAPTGRGRTLRPSPVGALAVAEGIPVLSPAGARSPEFAAQLAALGPDAGAIVAYGALLPPAVLAVPTHGWINLHFSVLPAWRGAAPVHAAVRHGDDITGATTFRLEEGMDTGPVFGTVTETIRPTDTTGALLDRLADSGAALLVATLDGIEAGTVRAQPQPAHGISYAPKLTAADQIVRWTDPAPAIERTVRSLTPEPGAFTTFRGDRLGIGPVERTGLAAGDLPPGVLAAGRRDVLVGTGTAPLRLVTVRPAGRREMLAPDWARGIRDADGELLGEAS